MLELSILGFLHEEPLHGYELKQRLQRLTGHFRPLSDGALYPAIARLEKQGFLTRHQEQGEAAAPRNVLSLTPPGEAELIKRLGSPTDVDISDRNRFFTFLAFLKYLPTEEQQNILERRLLFLQKGRSFFQVGGKLEDESDQFRIGMHYIARETTKIEQRWLGEMIETLNNSNK